MSSGRRTCLGDVAWSRDNNLNLVRFLAASAVLVSHSYALATGDRHAEPLRATLGMTMGSIAVDVFFLISGFLVTGSLFRQPQLRGFVTARARRIFPGLLVMLALTVFVAGPLLSVEGMSSYFADSQVYRYFMKCATLVFGVVYVLPGVFDANPHGSAVNGSLWTLPVEVRCYVGLALAWLLARTWRPKCVLTFPALLTTLAVLGASMIAVLVVAASQRPTTFMMLTMFAAGAASFVHRARFALNLGVATALVATLAALAAWGPAALFWLAYTLMLPYVVFSFAYLPGGWPRKFNALGDYSYGIYIYAFPIQQFFVSINKGIGPWYLTALSFPAVLFAAVLSWHLVESRALAKGRPAHSR